MALQAKAQQLDGAGEPDGQAGEPDGQAGEAPRPGQGSAEPLAADEQWDVVLDNPHGLHARPAAALVSALRGFDAHVELSNVSTGAGAVDASSLSAVTGLQLREGQVMRVRATGPEAAGARAALEQLAADHFGDHIENPTTNEDTAAPTGPVRGPVRIVALDADISGYRPADAATEQRRLDEALAAVDEHLRAAAPGPMAAIFGAQAEMLADPVLARKTSRRIAAGDSALGAASAVLGEMATGFDKLTDPYLRERGQDVRSLRRLLVLALTGADWSDGREVEPGIWVLPELDAITAATADMERCLGMITTTGGRTGHGAMIARSRGIPLVLGVPDASMLADGELVEIDPSANSFRRVR
nr:HPr family phosphocarrier protein [Propionibacterium cyclohexanicum]